MQGSTMWRNAMVLGVCGMLVACGPQPPLEVVSEPPDFASGATQQPVVGPAPAPPPVTVVESPAPVVSDGETVVTGDPFTQVVDEGPLVERLPNTCKLENYQQFAGQSATVLSSAALDRAWRVVGPTTIVTQEYNPARLNFRTNGNGVIQRITCG